LEPGDLILVKGSQGVRMEKVVEQVMADPEQKETLLVRQDEECFFRCAMCRLHLLGPLSKKFHVLCQY